MVLRGDECVSFGWCFWHRACYGCLLCGSRAVCAGTPLRALFADVEDGDGEDGKNWRRRRGGGREVNEPPLCAMCVVGVEVDGLGRRAVLRKGLRRVDAVDGGVTRARRAMKEEAEGTMTEVTGTPVSISWRGTMGSADLSSLATVDGVTCHDSEAMVRQSS